jgi:hypothetical protein
MESIVFNGLQASFMREMLQKLPTPNRQDWVASAMGVPASDLKAASFEGIMEIHGPLKVLVDYQLPNQFHTVGNEMVGILPACFERSHLLTRAVEKRMSPFDLNFPFLLESSVTVEPPPGYRIKNDLGPEARFGNRFVQGNLAGRWTAPAIRYETTVFQPADRFPAADYPEYCRAMTEAASLLTPKLVFRKGGN